MRAAAKQAAISSVAAINAVIGRAYIARIYFRCMFVRSRKHSRSISQLYTRSKIFTADSVPR